MAKKKRRASDPIAPLVRVLERIGSIDAAAVVGELRRVHERAQDPDVEQMPADNELHGALIYAEQHHAALRTLDEAVRRAAAIKRTLLWEYLRQQTDVHQLRAVDDARAEGAEWAAPAPALAVRAPPRPWPRRSDGSRPSSRPNAAVRRKR